MQSRNVLHSILKYFRHFILGLACFLFLYLALESVFFAVMFKSSKWFNAFIVKFFFGNQVEYAGEFMDQFYGNMEKVGARVRAFVGFLLSVNGRRGRTKI